MWVAKDKLIRSLSLFVLNGIGRFSFVRIFAEKIHLIRNGISIYQLDYCDIRAFIDGLTELLILWRPVFDYKQ